MTEYPNVLVLHLDLIVDLLELVCRIELLILELLSTTLPLDSLKSVLIYATVLQNVLGRLGSPCVKELFLFLVISFSIKSSFLSALS